MIHARITGTGSFAPKKTITNQDLEKLIDTTDEWITDRTGIKERRVVEKGQTTSDLAYEASKRALKAAGVGVEEIDLILVATMTPDMILPSLGCVSRKNSEPKKLQPSIFTRPVQALSTGCPLLAHTSNLKCLKIFCLSKPRSCLVIRTGRIVDLHPLRRRRRRGSYPTAYGQARHSLHSHPFRRFTRGPDPCPRRWSPVPDVSRNNP